ncbi:acyl- dehydrogenase [Trichoderma arundinaceum]|uniref:Acyl-dehydrogenase n=1 Tax=Trichoderma arundinaceum TaxID=490622 RepID=A0A395NIN7_TRIAR|nr:acyl- dehydrogenase [Trichoderma arundinaceum]
MNTLRPSTSTTGFFQIPPDVKNQYYDDAAFNRALSLFLSKEVLEGISQDLSEFGAKVLSPKVFSWVLDAERNTPYVKTFDSWGRRRDELITSEGWRNLQALGQAEGMVAIPYENHYAEFSRVYHFAKYALWCGSAAWVNCPSLMSDGVAALFRKHITESCLSNKEEKILRSAYERLISRDPTIAWTTGQWMTERQGGSDVSMTESIATYDPKSLDVEATDGNDLGPWRIDGFKWFSSATDCNMMVMLARTSKGISTFFAPMRKTLRQRDVLGNDTELNGVTIQRLKDKLGTRALPTAELVLNGVRAWLVGEDGRGTKEIATVLNIARIHNGATAIGLWGRGLGIVRAFTRVRVIGGRPLWERSAFMRTLARMHAEYKANVLFNFFVAGLLGVTEQEQVTAFTKKLNTAHSSGMGQIPGLSDVAMAKHLLRLLTPVLKGHCAKTAISGLQECMECLGGVGYLENEDMQFNIARLYRDANVMPIWEGTTDMMADDSILRVLHGKLRAPVLDALEAWVTTLLDNIKKEGGFYAQHDQVTQWWADVKASVQGVSKKEAELKSRATMDSLVDVVQGLLLLCDSIKDGDVVARLVTEAWFLEKNRGMRLKQKDWKSQIDTDLKIVFGPNGLSLNIPKL